MRVANCKTVCREIEEADHGQRLSTSATEHLGGCRQCQTFYDERSKLRQMVASLETVAAPPDFNFRVRSRLARDNANNHVGFFFRNFSIGVPSIALATLVLMVGGVFALRTWNAQTNSATALRTETSDANPPNVVKSDQGPLAGKSEPTSTETKSTATATTDEGGETPRPVSGPRKRNSLRSTVVAVRSSSRVATKEFSSTPAPVVKQEEAVASLETFPIFLIEASAQPLRVSLDYDTGVSRTISVPTLSFGSEGTLTNGGSSLVKTSAKRAW